MNIQDELQKYHADALSLAVVKNDRIDGIFAVGDGVTPHTRFQAASVSKMVFTLAVLKLVSEGRLDLEDDVNAYLSDCPLLRRDGTKGKATIRQLLTHTAGTGVHGFEGYPVGSALPETKQILAGEPPCNSPGVYQEHVPGKRWRYSGGGFMLLQKCAENITGMDFADFMDQYVLSPLKMDDSSFRQDLTENLACGYTQNFQPVPNGHYLMPEQAAAGLWTTAADLARFGLHIQRILRGDEGLIPQGLARQMTAPQHEEWLELEGTRCRTGLGCYLKILHGKAYFGHSGGNEGFESLVNFSVEGGSGCCVLLNANEAYPLTRKLQDVFLP